MPLRKRTLALPGALVLSLRQIASECDIRRGSGCFPVRRGGVCQAWPRRIGSCLVAGGRLDGPQLPPLRVLRAAVVSLVQIQSPRLAQGTLTSVGVPPVGRASRRRSGETNLDTGWCLTRVISPAGRLRCGHARGVYVVTDVGAEQEKAA